MDFETRYAKLNAAQKQAVDQVDGPVMVIAGPGTGKTELLSMRAANILRTTDTLPSNILCLTFTESGANAMRARLSEIIGRDAYKVAIHTFHSFGSEIIASNREYFYRGAEFRPADELSQLEILTGIFDELTHSSVLASKMNDEYTYLRETLRTISELKRSGLTSDELLRILDVSDAVLDFIERDIAEVFGPSISKKTIEAVVPLAQKLTEFTSDPLPLGLTPLAAVMAHSLARAYDEASAENSTKPLTTWKKQWCEKNVRGDLVLKDRKRHERLRAISFVYYRYLQKMQEASLYDFDDMILEVIHAIETQNDLKLNLQETYQYIQVDEFQDTNLAQLRLLLNLVDNPVNEGAPNLLTVGDDDQAIYSFQGADVNNILQLRARFPSITSIVLSDNYRSAPTILDAAHEVIVQGSERLEHFESEFRKTLTPHISSAGSNTTLSSYEHIEQEMAAVARDIAARIKAGTNPGDIAILARKHSELEAVLPYLGAERIAVGYERRDNVLELDVVMQLELLARIAIGLLHDDLAEVDTLLPELLSHPAWNLAPELLWKLSLEAYREHQPWSERMSTLPELAPLHAWLIELAAAADHEPFEKMIDELLGAPDNYEPGAFHSPLFDYFFSDSKRTDDPESYLVFLDALRTLRAGLREYAGGEKPTITLLLDYIDLHRKYGRGITSVHRPSERSPDSVNVMTVHASKGLEFPVVYIIGLSDQTWGARARSASRKISYPENLPLIPTTGSLDEQLRLLFVGMTRAKKQLLLSYSRHDEAGREHLISDFLVDSTIGLTTAANDDTIDALSRTAEFDWRAPLVKLPQRTMRELLAPMLEHYKLSATHVNNFIDITRGGPQYFLLNNLLHFPSAPSPAASFGTAIHAALQSAESHLLATGEHRPLEDVLHDFETVLQRQSLDDHDMTFYTQKGVDTLSTFLTSTHTQLSKQAKPEYDFGTQGVHSGDAALTGKLDIIRIDSHEKTAYVFDYKTGKPSPGWKGTTDYEKVKLHKYKQQLMFYRLLIENARSFEGYRFAGGALQFVEPDASGVIQPPLEAEFTAEEYATFQQLVCAVWQCITTLTLPDVAEFSSDYKGIQAFEAYLIDEYGQSQKAH